MSMANEFEGGIDAYRDNLANQMAEIEQEISDEVDRDNETVPMVFPMVYGVLDEAFGDLFDDTFVVHGFYGVSNSGGYEVQLSDSCDGARLRDSETGEVSEWAEIIYEPDFSDMEHPDAEWLPVIPLWGGIPLNEVMRV